MVQGDGKAEAPVETAVEKRDYLADLHKAFNKIRNSEDFNRVARKVPLLYFFLIRVYTF